MDVLFRNMSSLPVLPLPRIRQIVALFPILATAVGAMGFPMTFSRTVPMPFLAMFTPYKPANRAFDPSFISGKHGGIEIDNGGFTNGDFHFNSFPIAASCSPVGNASTR